MPSIVRKSALTALVALLLCAISPPGTASGAEGYKLIVHSSNPATSLPREQVARYVLKKVTSWPSGLGVQPVDRERESTVRAAFSRSVLHKSVSEVSAYWQQQIFSGRGVPPPEKRSDAEVVAFVTGNEGGIGYVSGSADVGDAKVVAVVD
jgi:ABC-type phosphate transport system substrate-binding protein